MNSIKLVASLLAFLAIISTPRQQASAVSPEDASRDPVSIEPQLSPLLQDQAAPRPAPVPQDNPGTENPREAPQNDPDRAEAHFGQGVARSVAGDFPGAILEFREALRLQPNFVQARASVGLTLYLMGDVDRAIEEYRAVLRLQPDLAQVHVNLATALMAKREWTAARTELQTALTLQQDLVQAHYSLGAVRYTLGDIAGAVEAYRAALHLKQDYADAHYNLGLMLKLTNQEADAIQEFLAAARAGLPKAQYFLGNAYASGLGAEKDLATAVKWWSRAAEQGMTQASEALAQLRQIALRNGRPSSDEARSALQAFEDYRNAIWQEFPDLSRETTDESAGASLLRQGRVGEALPVLVREASALSDPAQNILETLYEQGIAGQLMAHDGRILAYFFASAAEGLPRPRVALARIYARGLGVPQDLNKARGLLKGNHHEDAKRLLRELSVAQQDAQQAQGIHNQH
ncbi:MAG: tetratricopeptide repeat protein [Nitrospiraceae bacterium]